MNVFHTKLSSIVLSLSMLISLASVPALAAEAAVRPAEAAALSSSASKDECIIDIKDSEHGRITASPNPAQLLDTVTLTVLPDSGYKLDEIVVTSSMERKLRLTAIGNGQYTFIMPSGTATVKAFFVPQSAPVESISFSDVSDSAQYADAVYYVANRGIMSGTGADTFSPEDTLTRAMAAQILYALEGKPNIGTINFGDVTYEDWYCDAVSWASAKWVMTGYGEGRFIPNNPVTREQLSLALLNFANLHNYDTRAAGDLSAFSDSGSVSSWATEAVTWAVGAGILSSRAGGLLAPGEPATRAEIAQSLMQFCEVVAK